MLPNDPCVNIVATTPSVATVLARFFEPLRYIRRCFPRASKYIIMSAETLKRCRRWRW